jgi:hypothetical protein
VNDEQPVQAGAVEDALDGGRRTGELDVPLG